MPSTPPSTYDSQSARDVGTLLEALPYIREFHGKTVVIKYGGAAMIDASLKEEFARDVVLLKYVGMNPVIVHGGGPEISAWQERMGIETKFINGLRVTDAPTMEIAKMVLTGKVGPDIVARIHTLGAGAIGLSGEDGPTLLVRPRTDAGGADLGFVGDVAQVNGEPLMAILDQGRIPVMASIGLGYDGQAYNVNADTVAAELAVSLHASKLILMTDVAGVRDGDGALISQLDAVRARKLLADSVIRDGMIPKVEAAIRATEGGSATHIIDARVPHALLLELLTERGVGTMLTETAPS
jgi:acetylglutamate kinase